MQKIRQLIQWGLVAILLMSAFIWSPSGAALTLFLAAVLLVPLKVVEDFYKKIKLTLVIRIILVLVLIVITAKIAPEQIPREAAKEAQKSSSSENKDKKDDESDVKAQIIGTWHYGDESRAIDEFFTFNEDGTWKMTSSGGTYDNGTYEIVDGKKIEMKGTFYDFTFKIKNSDQLTNDDGEKLTRYVKE